MNIKLSNEKWMDLCNIIDNEGLDYFLMHYTSVESFKELVDGDEEAVRLFKEAEKSLFAFSNYLRLNDF